MKTKSNQVSQVFSSAAKSALSANQELNDGGLIWRKLSDSTGSWRYDFSSNGKRCKGVIGRERDGITLRAAREKFRKIRAKHYLETERLDDAEGRYTNVSFETAARSYLDWAKINRSGYRQTEGRMNNQLIPYFERFTIGEINASTVASFQSYLLSEEYSNNTVRLCMSLLSSVYKHMQLDDVSLENPTRSISKPSKTIVEIKTVTNLQFEQLMDACGGELKYQVAICLAYYAGLRASEILGLDWNHVDFSSREITICKKVVDGKLINSTKSGKVRVIPIQENLLELLIKLKSVCGDDIFVVSNEKGSHYHHIQKIFSKLKTNIVDSFEGGIHVLRHTFATTAVTKGVHLPVLQIWMGHSDIKTTMGYVHISALHSSEQMKLMN